MLQGRRTAGRTQTVIVFATLNCISDNDDDTIVDINENPFTDNDHDENAE